jgi:hypothetical protein
MGMGQNEDVGMTDRTCLSCQHLKQTPSNYLCARGVWYKFARKIASGEIRGHLMVARECPLYVLRQTKAYQDCP